MWVLSTLETFRRWVSRVSTFLILVACGNLVGAALFQDYRLYRIVTTGAVLLLALVTKRALWTFETNPRSAIETIEKSFYTLFGIGMVGGVYIVGSEPVLLSLPGLMLVVLNAVVAILAFRIAQKNISFAKSLATNSS
jgi:hypothetical protein